MGDKIAEGQRRRRKRVPLLLERCLAPGFCGTLLRCVWEAPCWVAHGDAGRGATLNIPGTRVDLEMNYHCSRSSGTRDDWCTIPARSESEVGGYRGGPWQAAGDVLHCPALTNGMSCISSEKVSCIIRVRTARSRRYESRASAPACVRPRAGSSSAGSVASAGRLAAATSDWLLRPVDSIRISGTWAVRPSEL